VSPLDEAKGIRDQAEAIRVYAKSAKLGLGIQNYAAQVKILAEQRGGKLIAAMEKSPGGRSTAKTIKAVLEAKTKGAADFISHRWQTMADRIQARAIRRCGELLRQIAPKSDPGRPSKNGADADPISRTQAATDAGLSRGQKRTALRVANVADGPFETAVESDDPPTVTALAQQGRRTDPFRPS
jgi:hypothetical protein